MKVCFETFGCRLNKAEALQMESDYLAAGWELTDRHAEADCFVVRGCSVTARAQRECEKLIEHLRRRYPMRPIRVCGCLAKKSFPIVHAETSNPEENSGAVPMRTARAYLKVQDGCSGKCSFCIVPQFRGKSVSVEWDVVLDRARRFVESGYREIVVTGCNLSLYASAGRRLPELVAALASACGTACRIRLGSLEPGACARETIRVMAENAAVCRFLHIPVQAGSDRILNLMKRPYTIQEVEETVELASKLMPGLGLGCDLMTGFPDESPLDFKATANLLTRLPFNLAHVFPYSERPGTPAAGFSGRIPPNERHRRAHRLSEIIAAKRFQYANGFLGQTVEIISENESQSRGWTSEYLSAKTVSPIPRKSSARLFVTQVHHDATLEGRLVKDSPDGRKGV